jgi:lauroyl/myristoyl acyltransferase
MFRYYLFELLRFVVHLFPPRLAYGIGAFLAEATYVFSRKSKPNLRANLVWVLRWRGEETESPEARRRIWRLVRKNFRNFSYYLIDFFRFSRFAAEEMKRLVRFSGIENVRAALAGGKGALGVTAHVGNWELGGMMLALAGFPVNAIALSHENTKLNRLFVNQRGLTGMKVIPVGRAALRSLRALKRNELVLILGDRDVTERGVEVEFFGRPVSIPRGPSGLAARSGAAVFFGYLVRESTHRYRAVFRPPLEIDRSADRESQEEQIIRGLMREMEECIADHLDQWYMYYPVWP